MAVGYADCYGAGVVIVIVLYRLDVGAGIVLVNEFKTYYTLISGNVIDNDKLVILKRNIEQINQMDEETLKNYRKEKLKQKRDEGDKGAGVGLIDIARKSSRQIELRIKELENDKSFISFYILLEKEL